jgi:hypothetical protein
MKLPPELEAARREGESAYEHGMSQESNPYTDNERYGPAWHWSDAWWQKHCDSVERKIERAR